MAPQKGTLLSYRPDIKVLDATIRDGGLVNSFYFTDEFVKKLYQANVKAGVDYMEFGYKASKELFDVDKFGKWKFCDEKSIRDIVGENDTDMKISVMADVGRTDLEHDILDRKDSVIDLVRVATYINTIPAAIDMAEYCKSKGYETSINIMAISTSSDKDIKQALELIGQSGTDMIYIVDSYGSMYPEQIRELADMYTEVGAKYNKKIGIHAHNNQQMAFANTIEATAQGVSMLDATMSGMGRGAGNCAMEALMGFLKNPKYKINPVLRFVQEEMLKLKNEGLVWGYDVPYLLTGILNVHPRSAIEYIKENKTDYAEFYQGLWDKEC
ncbi:MAG: aldolase catalytic domain-containing protein [Oscillospiraceae bacterium]|nr:aldolase catalytic domain-containing protein [Oscillospiraceae bacterium]